MHKGQLELDTPGRLLAVLGGCLEDWKPDLGLQHLGETS